MQSRNKNILIFLVFFGLWFFINFYYAAFADSVGYSFSNQSASQSGSNNSLISVGSYLEYINRWDNSSIIGNYFQRGVYYDSIFWFFKTDWSSNQNQNVRIVSSTSKCSSGYGYKLGGFAYSTTAGFIDFDYSGDIFVYYCVQDASLYGYAYSPSLWFQNFQGISFDINKVQEAPTLITGTWFFTNDTSAIKNPVIEQNTLTPPNEQAINSNFTPNTIQANKVEFEALENLFFISSNNFSKIFTRFLKKTLLWEIFFSKVFLLLSILFSLQVLQKHIIRKIILFSIIASCARRVQGTYWV